MRTFFCFLCFLLATFSLIAEEEYDSEVQAPARKRSVKTSRVSHPAVAHRVRPLIILDAGHGGSDEGACVKSFQEKQVTLTTTLLAKDYLEEMGHRVVLTRSRDVFLSLHRRASLANKTQGTLFVSIHFNASKAKEAKGVEIYYCNGEETWRAQASKRLANCVLYHLVQETQAHSRGVKEGNFHVIRETQMPAVLVEGGFVTNPEERSQLKSRQYLDQIAKGVAEGIDKYLK
jgi:N-acetylmuramoyl-L-alanine amidase